MPLGTYKEALSANLLKVKLLMYHKTEELFQHYYVTHSMKESSKVQLLLELLMTIGDLSLLL